MNKNQNLSQNKGLFDLAPSQISESLQDLATNNIYSKSSNVLRPMSVSELNIQISAILEANLSSVYVSGEVSNLTKHSSGHFYFTLKDSVSLIACVMFKMQASSLAFNLEEGMNVIVSGELKVYQAGGRYQIICKKIEPDGIGALTLAFEQLKKKLESKGYFDKKKPLPAFPRRIALVTSGHADALFDMLKVARKRWSALTLVLFDSLVQGKGAKESLAKNIRLADSFFGTNEEFDIIVVSRGGGSLEDLWAFNEEIVADAIYEARTLVVSAVGHQRDVMISDFVADFRAPTPSAAMEEILPDCSNYLLRIDEYIGTLSSKFECMLEQKAQILESAAKLMNAHNFLLLAELKSSELHHLKETLENLYMKKMLEIEQKIAPIRERLKNYFDDIFARREMFLENLSLKLEKTNPNAFIAREYVEILKEGRHTNLSSLQSGDKITLSDGKAHKQAEIL